MKPALVQVKDVMKDLPATFKGLHDLRRKYKMRFGAELKLKTSIKNKVMQKKYGNTFINLVG